MKIYNKAVRDRIPEIITSRGEVCNYESLPDDEFLPFLQMKLLEESNEYIESEDAEELADLLETISRIAEIEGISMEKLDEIRKEKSKIAG
ncbi:nucleoside triphosphate pyrophosphohydrolase [Methanolacinia paynteri]|uniref:nucleoside triphosphate pyrophosphohydrolase n=1 Tax=Methanolacinia paynteri TaxID=230356 RepID=UPI00064EC0B7|nr:nucleoside triphosphate pyrophosphohydrolase [Methanolacinia paynteri]